MEMADPAEASIHSSTEPSRSRVRLPVPLTSFLGRERELADVSARVPTA